MLPSAPSERMVAVAQSSDPSGGFKTISGMPQNFMACDREQELLLPPSLREWLPEDHFAWFVIEVVDGLDLARVLWPRIGAMAGAARRTIRR